MMHIRVLGPLSIHHGAVEITPTAQKPRTLLALLLLNHEQVVPVSEMMDELWKGAPPKNARAALQIYVFHLRKRLAQCSGSPSAEVAQTMLQTVQNGYRLAVEPRQFDLEIHHRLQREGGHAMAAGDFRSAAMHFREALNLWHGPMMSDVEPGTRIRAEAAALEQSRMTMLDYRIELDLKLGLHRQILSELAVLTSQNRFHENFHAQYMIALYRSGYRIRALELFHKLRRNLLDEFGLEPSPKLKEFHQSVLTLDPALDDAEVVTPPPRPAADLPEIPALASSF
ncbi:AfsR/SARP family transcriptional regulator [Streptomyces sp. NPDC001832]|uniref:AfsR/SARP family transcriptional regulator n=1 Tax=Streptomyces sp. NPDC001832 TaxID=3154527 RepID=UPI00332C0515